MKNIHKQQLLKLIMNISLNFQINVEKIMKFFKLNKFYN